MYSRVCLVLSIVLARFIHVAILQFFLLYRFYCLACFVWIYHCLPILLLKDLWIVSNFWLLWVVLLDILSDVFWWTYKCMPDVHLGMEFLDHKICMHMLGFDRYCQTIFQSGCTNFYSCKWCVSALVDPHPYQHQHGQFVKFVAILLGVKWHLATVWFSLP